MHWKITAKHTHYFTPQNGADGNEKPLCELYHKERRAMIPDANACNAGRADVDPAYISPGHYRPHAVVVHSLRAPSTPVLVRRAQMNMNDCSRVARKITAALFATQSLTSAAFIVSGTLSTCDICQTYG